MNYKDRISTQQGLKQMVGKTFVRVRGDLGEDLMEFETSDGEKFIFAHLQDCCERVDIHDIVGDLNDLMYEPLLVAEEVNGETPVDFAENEYSSYTWTFYKFATRKGYVDVRWLGESNGYYSESVDMFYRKD